jgi:hypothetical protein
MKIELESDTWNPERPPEFEQSAAALRKSRLRFATGAPPPPHWQFPPGTALEAECRKEQLRKHYEFWPKAPVKRKKAVMP